MSLVHHRNTGAAFSMLSGGGARWAFVLLAVVFTAAVIYMIMHRTIKDPLMNWAMVLVAAGAVGNAIDRAFYGYVVDMWMLIIGTEPFEELWLRWVMLIVGDTVTCAGVAFFFRTYLPVEAYELFVNEVSRVRKFNLHKVKWIFDFSCLAVSIVLAFSIFGDATTFDWATIYTHSFHHIGLGTIVTTVISAPLINVISIAVRKLFGEDPIIKPIHKILLIGGRLSTQVDETEMLVDESVDAVDSTDVDSSKE
jgi:lipoprotein signal peptidase